MENKQNINTVFGLVVIVFLAALVLIGGNLNSKKVNESNDQIAMSNLLKQRNVKIRILSQQLADKQKETDSIKKDLINAKNDLEAANKKMAAAAAVLSIPTPETTPATK